MVAGGGLGEPDVAAVAAEVAGFEGFGDVFFDDDGAAGGVDEPGACGEGVLVLVCGGDVCDCGDEGDGVDGMLRERKRGEVRN